MSVRTAERPGTAGPTEDRIFGTSDAVVVLDGATQPEPGGRTGGWLAEALGREIQRRLESSRGDLAALLAAAISTVADRYALRPGSDPSTTVSIVRWDDCYVDVLVLGDSPVVALTTAGGIRQVRDDRLQAVAAEQRRQLRERPGVDRWRQLHQAMLLQRNKPGGYWIAEATPEAAWHARRARWRRGDLVAVLAMTDGVSVGVDRYRMPPDWPSAFALTMDDPYHLIQAVHGAEESDPECRGWPRTKRHDDKAVAVVSFREP